jgi:hypothetical protein
MHTIVLVSDKACMDNSLQKAVETLFPECRIEVIQISHAIQADSPLAANPGRGA